MKMPKNDAILGNFKRVQTHHSHPITIAQVIRENLEVVQIQSSRLLTFFKEGLETLDVWMERSRKRRQLAQMNQFDFKDIGVTRSDARNEANKWFWQD